MTVWIKGIQAPHNQKPEKFIDQSGPKLPVCGLLVYQRCICLLVSSGGLLQTRRRLSVQCQQVGQEKHSLFSSQKSHTDGHCVLGTGEQVTVDE